MTAVDEGVGEDADDPFRPGVPLRRNPDHGRSDETDPQRARQPAVPGSVARGLLGEGRGGMEVTRARHAVPECVA